MRTLIIHPEARAFAGAERVPQHFLEDTAETDGQVTVAVAAESKCAEAIPKEMEKIFIVDNGRFSLVRLWQRIARLFCEPDLPANGPALVKLPSII